MNKLQVLEVVKGLMVAGGPIVILLVNLFGVDVGVAERTVQALGSVLSAAGLVWMVLGKTDYQMVKDAANVQGIAKIKVDPDTTNVAALKAATDPSLANVKLGETTST